jgi:hypothetical protein
MTVVERTYAGRLDKRVDGPDNSVHGHHLSPEAIGGYYGIGWYEYFEDRETGEIYRVHCYDGVYRSKSSYTDEDEIWRENQYELIVARTKLEAVRGAKRIYLSTNEWILMQGFTHAYWLDPKDGEEFARQTDNSIEQGRIGYVKGVPVIVRTDKKDNLL